MGPWVKTPTLHIFMIMVGIKTSKVEIVLILKCNNLHSSNFLHVSNCNQIKWTSIILIKMVVIALII